MRARIVDEILILKADELPPYKKGGSIVRNNYFWALKSIAVQSGKGTDWEFDAPVWTALERMLSFFTQSGYLGYQETILEFGEDQYIPEELRGVSTRL